MVRRMLMKVRANLVINGTKLKVKSIDVPIDKCNRDEFLLYIKEVLLDSSDIKVEFSLGDSDAYNK
jgi:hypothetical protein